VNADDLRRLADRGATDPVWWVDNILGAKPWLIQAKILESVRDNHETNVRSCHSAGKSWIAARAALWFLCNHPESLVITTAPTARQVRGILWREINSAWSSSKMPLGGECLQTVLRFSPSWLALGFTASDNDPDRFQGFHADSVLVIVDEAAGVSEEIDTAIDSILSAQHARLLRIGNPTNIASPFGQAFQRQRGNRFAITAFDTPNFTKFGIVPEDIKTGEWKAKITDDLPRPSLIAPGWVADKASKWGTTSPLYQSRILAEFPTSSATMVFDLAMLEKSQRREAVKKAPISFGVDIARHGSDETVVAMRVGDRVTILDSWTGSDTMQSTGRVVSLYKAHKPVKIFVDEIGIGAGVLDRLTELGLPAVGINVGKYPRDRDRFENLRAELFWNLREMCENDELSLPDDPLLIEQMASIRYEFTSRGKIKLESKMLLSDSPDRADAVALAISAMSSDVYDAIDIPSVGLRSSPWSV
jgi:phage terminase large subunit